LVADQTHQTADFGKLTVCICRGDRVARRQIDQLDTSAEEKAIAANEERLRLLARNKCERRTDLAAGTGVEYLGLHSHGTGSGFCVSS
jgi:hypothetical protein